MTNHLTPAELDALLEAARAAIERLVLMVQELRQLAEIRSDIIAAKGAHIDQLRDEICEAFIDSYHKSLPLVETEE